MNKRYHFIGIGGIGMGALASLLLAKGHEVSGSDIRHNYIISGLIEKGAGIVIGHDARNIEGADFIIFSSAIDGLNPELKAAREKQATILQRAELLADLMKGHIGITVAGAHGKTTITSMASNLLIRAGLSPTTAIGGIVNETASNALLGDGRYFVAEVDESDGSFLYFSPEYSIISNIDFEHLDYYQNWDNILGVYRKFISKTARGGIILGYGDDERLFSLLKESGRLFKTYGFLSLNDLIADNIQYDKFCSSFDCIFHGKKLGRILLQVPGRHNIANALACISLGVSLGIDFNIISDSLKGYAGVRRRFQIAGQVGGICVIDDYAHHPTEINSTLQAAQLIKKQQASGGNRLIAVFQPHRYSRLKALFEQFARSLINCDYLIVTDVYGASEKKLEGVSAERLSNRIKEISNKPVVFLKKDEIVDSLHSIAMPGDIVMTLGAGDITSIAGEFVSVLKKCRGQNNCHCGLQTGQ